MVGLSVARQWALLEILEVRASARPLIHHGRGHVNSGYERFRQPGYRRRTSGLGVRVENTTMARQDTLDDGERRVACARPAWRAVPDATEVARDNRPGHQLDDVMDAMYQQVLPGALRQCRPLVSESKSTRHPPAVYVSRPRRRSTRGSGFLPGDWLLCPACGDLSQEASLKR